MSDTLLAILFTAISGIICAFAIGGFLRSPRTPASRRAVIAQYTPPAAVSVLEAAIVLNSRRSSISAQIVDLAVRGVLRVREPDARGSVRQTDAVYRLELADRSPVSGEVEAAVIQAVFGRNGRPGDVVPVHPRNARLGRRLMIAQGRADAAVARADLVVRPANGWRPLLPIVQLVVVAPAMVWGAGVFPIGLLALLFGVTTLVLAFGRYHALSAQGVELRDYLLGLKLYISLAEADRMRVLQGPDTALTKDEVVLLTERLLGWAVLFGYGRQWAEILEIQRRESADGGGDNVPALVGFSSTFDGVAPVGASGEFADPIVGSDPAADSSSVGGMDFSDAGGSSGGNGGSSGGDGGGGDGGGGGGGGD